ncbi:hypothetical protein [Hymenobacter tenuis]
MKKLFSFAWVYLLLLIILSGIIGWQSSTFLAGAAPEHKLKKSKKVKKTETQRIDSLVKWTSRYRLKNPDAEVFTRSHYIDKSTLKDILNNTEGIRIYPAIDSAGANRLVIVGVDKNGDDTFQSVGAETLVETKFLAYPVEKCPQNCDYKSILK